MSSTDLVTAYMATAYGVFADGEGFSLKPGVQSVRLAAMYARYEAQTAIFITAWSPYSRQQGQAENEIAHTQLRDALAATTNCTMVFEGEGRATEGDWPIEPSFLVLGPDFATACQLGISFRQNAILFAGADAVPQLVWLGGEQR